VAETVIRFAACDNRLIVPNFIRIFEITELMGAGQ
jgi:hypothetical protein